MFIQRHYCPSFHSEGVWRQYFLTMSGVDERNGQAAKRKQSGDEAMGETRHIFLGSKLWGKTSFTLKQI